MSRRKDEDRLIAGMSEAMRTKLRLNRHKSSWQGMTAANLLALLEAEVRELKEACEAAALDPYKLDSVRMEAADVANFAGMIADNADRDLGFGRTTRTESE